MKSILNFSAIIFLLSACSNNIKQADRSKIITSWEVNINTGDTINRMDGNDKKQGLWVENKKDTIIYKDGVAQ